MVMKCICCGEPISAYPCKWCGQRPAVVEECPWKSGVVCLETKRACPCKGEQYFNCKTFRGIK